MGEVLKFRKPTPKEKHKGKTLCGNGFHKWAVEQNKQFDVKLGKLVTLYKCARCGTTKVKAH